MDLQTFIDDVGRVVAASDDQHEITKRVAERLSALLASGYRLPPEFVRPSPAAARACAIADSMPSVTK